MKRKIKTNFDESLQKNNKSYIQYVDRMMNIAISTMKWDGLPDTMDARWLEYCLLTKGYAIGFEDEVLGYLNTLCTLGGRLDVYNIPMQRTAYANNGYQRNLTNQDSVIFFDNLLHTNPMLDIDIFASRLWEYDQIIDINARAQKTPILVSCDENERLTYKNIYQQYDGNAPVIFGRRGINGDALQVMKTDAPYVADKLYELKKNIWNEFLTFLGVSNVTTSKKANLITDEVQRQLGGTLANRYTRVESRKQAADMFNRMFGTNITVEFREPESNLLPEETTKGEVRIDEQIHD